MLFLRRHAIFGGTTGAGKSGGLNVLMGNLTACRDVVIWAIDLKKGMELQPWASCIGRLATTPEEAAAARTLVGGSGLALVCPREPDEGRREGSLVKSAAGSPVTFGTAAPKDAYASRQPIGTGSAGAGVPARANGQAAASATLTARWGRLEIGVQEILTRQRMSAPELQKLRGRHPWSELLRLERTPERLGKPREYGHVCLALVGLPQDHRDTVTH